MRGRKVILEEAAVDAYINGCSGLWIILTNTEKDASKALDYYNRRCVCDIEFHFDDMKNLLDCNRLNDLRGKVSVIKPRYRKC